MKNKIFLNIIFGVNNMRKVFILFLLVKFFFSINLYSTLNDDIYSEFILAASLGRINTAKYLFSQCSSGDEVLSLLNCSGSKGGSPLSWASFNGHLNIVEFLLENGADVNSSDKFGTTPLHWAVSKGNFYIARKLIEYGANIDAVDIDGNTPLIRAIDNGRYDMVKLLVFNGAEIDRLKNKTHILFIAAFSNNRDILNFLFQQDDVINITSKFGSRPLSWFAKKGMFRAVKAAILNGADINHQDDVGSTAILLASSGGHLDVVQLLLKKGADPNICNKQGNTPLLLSTLSGFYRISKLLLSYGADISALDNDGMSPLMNAVISGRYKLISFLTEFILHRGKNYEFRNVSKHGHRSVLGWLLRRHPRALKKGTSNPYTLDSFYFIFKMLIDKAGRMFDFSHLDRNGKTIVHWLAQSGEYKSLNYLLFFLYELNEGGIYYIRYLLTNKSRGADNTDTKGFIRLALSQKYFKTDGAFVDDLNITKDLIDNWISFCSRCSELDEIRRMRMPKNSKFHYHPE